MRVLIADGDRALLEILQSYLWDRGHEAEIAADALECIVMLREFAPHVLVLERELLWGGSEGVMAAMRGDSRLHQIPVILIADKRGGPDSMVDIRLVAWLQKPFRLSDLLGQLASASSLAQSENKRVGAT